MAGPWISTRPKDCFLGKGQAQGTQEGPALPCIWLAPCAYSLSSSGPLWPGPSRFKPRLTWRRCRIRGPCSPGDPSTAPCGLVWGTCPPGASLVPRAGRWPDSPGSESQGRMSTSDHTWPCSAPVGVNQSGITGVQLGWHFWKEKWSGRGSNGYNRTSGRYKRALRTRKGKAVASGSADRDRKRTRLLMPMLPVTGGRIWGLGRSMDMWETEGGGWCTWCADSCFRETE